MLRGRKAKKGNCQAVSGQNRVLTFSTWPPSRNLRRSPGPQSTNSKNDFKTLNCQFLRILGAFKVWVPKKAQESSLSTMLH